MKRSIVILVVLLGFPAAAAAQTPDDFNQVLLGDGPSTVSQPFTRSYDSSTYSFDAQFPTQERDRMGCGVGNGFRFGSRTAWHRFEAGGPGAVRLSASSSYDVMLFAFKTTLPRGAKGFGSSVLSSLECQDVRTGTADESFTAPMRVAAGDVLLLATASACGTAPCNAPTAGGATTLTVEFAADDRDGDGVADGADACPDVPAPGGCPAADPVVEPSPDADGDGVLLGRDRCPAVRGTTDDGCLDGDGDAVSDAVDACATVAGNGRDGCPQPLKATFSNLWTNFAGGSRVERLQVKAPVGARVQWRCAGKGCKRRSAGFSQRRPAESLLEFLTRGRRLARGAVIEVRVTAPLTLGTYTRFEIRGQRKNPRRTDRCITAAGALVRC